MRGVSVAEKRVGNNRGMKAVGKKNGRCGSASLTRPFRFLFPVARNRVTAGGRYPLSDLSSDNAFPAAFFPPVGSSLLVRRTNLLSPSVALLPVFKVTQITATETYYLRVLSLRQHFFYKYFFHRISMPEKERSGLAIFR